MAEAAAAITRRIHTTRDDPHRSLYVTINNHPSSIETDPHEEEEEEEEEEDDYDENFVLAKTSKEISSFRTIQGALKKLKIIMRKIHETHALFVCSENDWLEKTNHYMKQTNAFFLIEPVTKTKMITLTNEEATMNDSIQHILKNMNRRIIERLDHLFHSQAITYEHYTQMIYSNQTDHPLQVNQLYFIPKLYQNKIIIQPIVTSYTKEPIRLIASYLNLLLQPFIQEIIHTSTSLSTGHDAIAAFELYAKHGYLQSTTLLTTISILNLDNTLPHHLMLEELEKFLFSHVSHGHIEGISIRTILQLVQLVLENQFYIYENQLYQQIAGGPTQTNLIRALIDIYLFHLQQHLVSILNQHNELFGRSFNQIFLTWNGTKDELNKMIYQDFFMQSKYTSLQMKIVIDDQVQYLDAELGHMKGILQTRVYHNIIIEPHALPFLFQTQLKLSSSPDRLVRAALIRASLYCSNVIEFENERLFMDMSFIINEISFNLIQKIYRKFLHEFELIIIDDNQSCMSEEMYQKLRRRVQQYQQQRTHFFLRERHQQRKYRQRRIIKK